MHKSNESSFIANINTLAEQVTLLRKMEGILSGDVLKSLHRIANKDYGYLLYDLSKGVTREGCRKIDINLSKNSKKELRHVKYNRVGVKGAGSCDYTWIELENPTGKVHEILQAIHESIDKHNENTTTDVGRIENVELDLLTTAEGIIIRIKDKCDSTNLQSVALVVDSLYVENALESRLEVSWYTTTSSILSTICTLKSIQKEKVELEITYEEVYATISALVEEFVALVVNSTRNFTELAEKYVKDLSDIEIKVGADRDVIEGILERVINNFKELGYTYIGDYIKGITINEYNQLVRDENGEFWRLSGKIELPYTTTGEGAPENGALVPVGDAVLRHDLTNPDKGAAMVAYGEGTVAEKLDEIVSGAVTEPLVDAKVYTHNQDANSHPELRTRIVSEVSSHVTAEADRAETALAGVEQALDLGAADIYINVASGLAGTLNTENFWVVPNEGDGIENLTLYSNNGSVAVKLYELYNLESFMIEEGANWETGDL